MITKEKVAGIIDASIAAVLAPTQEENKSFLESIKPFPFAAVAVEPFYVRETANILAETKIAVACVISYPLSVLTSDTKLSQAAFALHDGADELDIAMSFADFKAGRFDKVKEDLKPIVYLTGDRIKKMIYYSALLSTDEQKKAVELAVELGFDFVKTNPGYGYVTKPEHIMTVKNTFNNAIKVMASGGVRTKADALAMIEAGTDRIATSAALNILSGFEE